MSDEEARRLLQLLHQYTMEYGVYQGVDHLASDLAMSLDVTSDEDDRMRREIETKYIEEA